MLAAYYVAAYSSTKWVLVIRKNLPEWDVLQEFSGGGALRLPCSWSRLLQSLSLTVMFPKILLYTFPIFSFTLFCTNLQEHRALLTYVQGSQIVSDTREPFFIIT